MSKERKLRDDGLIDLGGAAGQGAPAGAEIPALDKKQKKEDRRGGAVPWTGSGAAGGDLLLGRGGGAAVSRVVGASRAGLWGARGLLPGLVNFLASNLGMTVLTFAVIGASVYGLYSLGMSSVRAKAPKKKPPLFARGAQDAASAPEIPADARTDASSLGYFAAANKGAFDEAAANAKAEAAPETPPPEAPAPEPPKTGEPAAAPADAGQAPQAGTLAGRLGALFDGGAKRIGSGVGLVGGSGMSGGMVKPFEQNVLLAKAERGSLSAARAAPRAPLTRAKVSPIQKGRQGAMGQLRKAALESNRARNAGVTEAKSFHAAEAFGGAPASAGGASVGGPGTGAGSAAPKGLDAPGDDGGPIAAGPGAPEQSAPPQTGEGHDVSPWTGMVMMAASMLMMASLIIFVMGLIAVIKKKFAGIPMVWAALTAFQKILYVSAIGMAAISSMLGMVIASQFGQVQQGLILTMGGAITAALAAISLWTKIGGATAAWLQVLAGVAGIAASIGGMIGG